MISLRIEDSVGIDGKNNPEDVLAVKKALNKLIHLIPPAKKVNETTTFKKIVKQDPSILALKNFQKQILRYSSPDGLINVNGKTHRIINEKLKLVAPAYSITTTVPWLRTAYKELGHAEVGGLQHSNPRIMKYIHASRIPKVVNNYVDDDSPGKNAWCGAFVHWVMVVQNHYPEVEHPYRASNWATFGRQISEPIQGAIAIKDRAGGKHVGFVVAKSSNGEYLYILGGNQANRVSVAKYKAKAYHTFVVPTGFDTTGHTLPIYNGTYQAAGGES